MLENYENGKRGQRRQQRTGTGGYCATCARTLAPDQGQQHREKDRTEKGECEERVLTRFAKTLGQLEWYAHATRAHREKVGTPK